MNGRERLVEVLRQWDNSKESYKEYRRGLLGRGTEGERSARVDGREGYYYVRNREDPRQIYQILSGDVPDIPGWPVIIGPNEVQNPVLRIIDSDWASLSTLTGYSGTATALGPHHQQHEWLAFDMVNVHKGMIIPFRARPATSGGPWDVIIEYDENAYLGPEWINFEIIPGYEATPLKGVRRQAYTGSTNPVADHYMMLCLTQGPNPDIVWVTGTSVTVPLKSSMVGGYPGFTGGASEIDGSESLEKPSIVAALARNLYPFCRVFVGRDRTGLSLSNFEPLQPLFTFPGRWYATGVIIGDSGNYFVGTDVEAALQELGARALATPTGTGAASSASSDSEHQWVQVKYFADGTSTRYYSTDFILPNSSTVYFDRDYQHLNVVYDEMPYQDSIKFKTAPTGSTNIYLRYQRAFGHDDLNVLANPYFLKTTDWVLESGTFTSAGHLTSGSITGMTSGALTIPVAYQSLNLRKGHYVIVGSVYSTWSSSFSYRLFNSDRTIERWGVQQFADNEWLRYPVHLIIPKNDIYVLRLYQNNNTTKFDDMVMARISGLDPSQEMFDTSAILKNGCFYDDLTNWTVTAGFSRVGEILVPPTFVGGWLKSTTTAANTATQTITLTVGATYMIAFYYYNQFGGSADIRILNTATSAVDFTTNELNTQYENNRAHKVYMIYKSAVTAASTFQIRSNNNNSVYFNGVRIYKISP